MTDVKGLEIKMKEAYWYIKSEVCARRDVPANPSDAELADALGGTIELKDSISFLREGTHNPTKRLIEAFKREFSSEIPESTIDARLVTPFQNL